MPSASCSVLYLAMMSSILENETYKQGNYVMLHKQFNLIQMESVEIQEKNHGTHFFLSLQLILCCKL